MDLFVKSTLDTTVAGDSSNSYTYNNSNNKAVELLKASSSSKMTRALNSNSNNKETMILLPVLVKRSNGNCHPRTSGLETDNHRFRNLPSKSVSV